MDITLLQMRTFLAVAESLSFTRAAHRLGVTQPTLSAAIRNLETAIGGKLFDRDTRKVALTALGLDCISMAMQLLDQADRVESQLRSHAQGRRGLVRLAAPANLYPTMLLPGLMAFRTAHPHVRLEFSDVTSDEAVHRLRQYQVDLAIGLHADGEKDLRSRTLGFQRYVAVLPEAHVLAGRRTIRWKDIRKLDLIILQARDSVTNRVVQTLRDADVVPQAAHRVNELATAAALVYGGFGIGLMLQGSAQHMLRPGLTIRELSEPAFNGKVSLSTLSRVELSPQLVHLQDALCRHAPAKG